MKNVKLPNNWINTNLLRIAKVYTGKKDANFASDNGQYYFFTCAFDPLFADSYSFEGEVLILPGNGANVGEVFYYKGKFEAYQRTYIIDEIKINPKYLFYFFRAFWKSVGVKEQFGSATNYIKIGNFKNFEINICPRPEQDRIVAKVDALMGQVSVMQESLQRIPQLLKDFRQQVLTQAVTGKLTEEWREGKDVEEWKIELIKELTTKVGSGSTPRGGKAAYKASGIPLLRSMNIHFYGIKEKGLAFIDNTQAEKLKNVEVKENDVLLNITGASIGRVCLAPLKFEGSRVNQHVAIIRTNEQIIPGFLNLYLASPTIQNFIIHENYGTTRQALTKTQILNLEIPTPPLDEQQEIVSRVESLFLKADAIQQQYEALKQKIDTLPQAILHKAFKGELVEQLESDGSAEELLREIEGLKIK